MISCLAVFISWALLRQVEQYLQKDEGKTRASVDIHFMMEGAEESDCLPQQGNAQLEKSKFGKIPIMVGVLQDLLFVEQGIKFLSIIARIQPDLIYE